MNKLRVLVADDHEEMRWTIVKTLLGHFDVVGAVGDGRKLVETAIALQPDVIVSDVAMPMLTGPEAMKELKSGCHCMPFVLISVNLSCVEQLIEQGAAGFVDKIDIGYELVAAVRSAAAREIYFSNGARASLLLDTSLQRSFVAKSRYTQ
jgi:DNA-binding NarL/FixJ family response regulator